MASKSASKNVPVGGVTPGTLELHDDAQWQQFARVVEAIRSMGVKPLSQEQAERLAK